MYAKHILGMVFLFCKVTAGAGACNSLGEQLTHDEPLVKTTLLALKPGEHLSGIRLCDNSLVFAGWRFIRTAKAQGPYQHVLLFKDGQATRAVAWVNRFGKSMVVPRCPYGPRCGVLPESATVISGDIYTFTSIKAGSEIVVLQYPPIGW